MATNMASIVLGDISASSTTDLLEFFIQRRSCDSTDFPTDEALLSSASVWLTDTLSDDACFNSFDPGVDFDADCLASFSSDGAVAIDSSDNFVVEPADDDPLQELLAVESFLPSDATAPVEEVVVEEVVVEDDCVDDLFEDYDSVSMKSSATLGAQSSVDSAQLLSTWRGGRRSRQKKNKSEANREAAFRYRVKQRRSNSLANALHSQLQSVNSKLEADVASAENELKFLLDLCRTAVDKSRRFNASNKSKLKCSECSIPSASPPLIVGAEGGFVAATTASSNTKRKLLMIVKRL